MMEMYLTRGENYEGVNLCFPATPGEIGEAFAMLDEISRYAGEIRIMEVKSPVSNLGKYIRCADLSSSEDIRKLNTLAERIDGMSLRQRNIFAGALDAESVNGLDDVLRISDSLEEYLLIPHVNSDEALGRYIAVASQIQGDPRFPEEAWPYLDFGKIGAEYYADHGGAYTYSGYVLRKQQAEPEQLEGKVIRIQLESAERMCILHLPAAESELEAAKEQLGIEDFAEAGIETMDFLVPFLEDHVPVDCICVEDANELALAVQEMQQEDGELLKFLSVLSVEHPEEFAGALEIARNLDDYERITEGTYEYGQSVLRRIGADDELINTIDGYMDFEKFGEDAMVEDGVRQTEFGLIRRCSSPFPEEDRGMRMGM